MRRSSRCRAAPCRSCRSATWSHRRNVAIAASTPDVRHEPSAGGTNVRFARDDFEPGVAPFEINPAGRGTHEAVDHPERRGLAASGRREQHVDLGCVHCHVDVLDDPARRALSVPIDEHALASRIECRNPVRPDVNKGLPSELTACVMRRHTARTNNARPLAVPIGQAARIAAFTWIGYVPGCPTKTTDCLHKQGDKGRAS